MDREGRWEKTKVIPGPLHIWENAASTGEGGGGGQILTHQEPTAGRVGSQNLMVMARWIVGLNKQLQSQDSFPELALKTRPR